VINFSAVIRSVCALAALHCLLAVTPALAQRDTWGPCRDAPTPEQKIVACSETIARPKTPAFLERAYLRRGNAYIATNNFAAAVVDFTKLIALKPRVSGYYDNRQAAYRSLGNIPAALNDANMSVKISPQLSFVYRSRGLLLDDNGQTAEAYADFSKAIEIDPRDDGLYDLRGKTLIKLGRLDDAIRDFNQAIAVNPPATFALKGRAEAYLAAGRHAEALSDLQTYVQAFPDDRDAKALLANSQLPTAPVQVATPLRNDVQSATAVVPAMAARRVALVIGNSSYRSVAELGNPGNDVTLVGNALRSAGFDNVTILHDLDRQGMIQALRNFGDEADNSDWALVYYAGHGIEMDGQNYLVPVDAVLKSDRDVPDETVSLERLLSSLSGARKLRMVVLDACRNNPFHPRITVANRSIDRGLSRIEPDRGTLVVYAAKDGTVAKDGTGADSPFAVSFANRITQPGIELGKAMRFVTQDVLQATGTQQEPFTYGALPPDDFYFVSRQ